MLTLCSPLAIVLQTCHLHIEGPVPHLLPEYTPYIRDKSFFTGANAREAVGSGRADYVPIFLSEVPALFRRGRQKVDVALITVSPEDKHGYHRYEIACAQSCRTSPDLEWMSSFQQIPQASM